MTPTPPLKVTGQDRTSSSTPTVDRAAILHAIYQRQALRRDARLPLLDIKVEYERAVEQALWSAHVEAHHDRVREEVLEELRAQHGRDLRGSVGGLWVVRLLTSKRLQEMFDEER